MVTEVGSIFVNAIRLKLAMVMPNVEIFTREAFPRKMDTADNSPITAGIIALKLELTIRDAL